jgi:AraC family transcriptional regulator
MIFHPRMQNAIEGFSVSSGPRSRHWDGIVADLWDVNCASYAGGHYISRDPRLFILLDHQGKGWPSARSKAELQKKRQPHEISRVCYIPAEMDLWLDFVDIQSVRHLDIHFDADGLIRRFGDKIDPQQLDIPNLEISDERVMTLARLVAAELSDPDPLHDLYSDGLIMALLIAVLKLPKMEARVRTPLAPWQLRRAKDYIEEHCLRAVRLEELASITGLSQSHFSHSFKASTGMSPHLWQINARLQHAKQMLAQTDNSLTLVATETGFSDHSHFSRVFRHHVGVSPSQWRKLQVG